MFQNSLFIENSKNKINNSSLNYNFLRNNNAMPFF